MESNFYDTDEDVVAFLKGIGVTKYTTSLNDVYQIHEHVYITKNIIIPKFRWMVFGNLEIYHNDILNVSRLPFSVHGRLKIAVNGLTDFNFYTDVYGKFIIDVKTPFLIQSFPNHCPEIIFNGKLEMSEINMEKIYEYEKVNNSTVYFDDRHHDFYMNWVKAKERIDVIKDIINS